MSPARLAALLVLLGLPRPLPAEPATDAFNSATLDHWTTHEGKWSSRDGVASADVGHAMLLHDSAARTNVDVSADVAYVCDETHAASGVLARIADDGTGYAASIREVEHGVDPHDGPWERPVVQLYRVDRTGWCSSRNRK
ncbi:MAG: hypothetical protein QM770_09220 [Tepidisphaeraceae bacterium]